MLLTAIHVSIGQFTPHSREFTGPYDPYLYNVNWHRLRTEKHFGTPRWDSILCEQGKQIYQIREIKHEEMDTYGENGYTLPADSPGHFFKNSFIFVIGYLNKLEMYMSIEYLLRYGSNLVTLAS